MSLKFETLRHANAIRWREWDGSKVLNLMYLAVQLGGEVGELLNLIKKLERERLGLRGSRTTVADIGNELADVVICADLVAQKLGLSLSVLVRDKFNETSRKVGLKTLLPPAVESEKPHDP